MDTLKEDILQRFALTPYARPNIPSQTLVPMVSQEGTARVIFQCMQTHLRREFAESERRDTNPIEAMLSTYYRLQRVTIPWYSGCRLGSRRLEIEFNDLFAWSQRSIRYICCKYYHHYKDKA